MEKDPENTNIVRVSAYIANILASQEKDPLCRRCKSFANGVTKTHELLAGREPATDLSPVQKERWTEARATLDGLTAPSEPVPQRKLGNCVLAEGKCLVKHSLKIFKREFPGADDGGCGCGCGGHEKGEKDLPVLKAKSFEHP